MKNRTSRRFAAFALLPLLAVAAPVVQAETKPRAAKANPRPADEPLAPVPFSDDFSGVKLAPHWIQKYEPPQFYIENGVMVAEQTNPKHGATTRLWIPFKDVTIEFDARFDGATSFNAVIEDKSATDVTWAGHAARFSIRGDSAMVSDDIHGFYNLKYRNLPIEERRAATVGTNVTKPLPTPANDGKWHNYRFQIRGENARLYYDGKLVAEITSPGFADPNKDQFGFTVNGSKLYIDNVKVTPGS